MGNLDHDAGSVTGFPVRTFSSPVAHISEDRQSLVHKLVSLVAADIDNHSHSAGIVFVCRIVQSYAHMRICFSIIRMRPDAVDCK